MGHIYVERWFRSVHPGSYYEDQAVAYPVRQMEAAEMDEVRVIRPRLTGPSSDGYPNGDVSRGHLSLSNFLSKRRVKTYNIVDSRLRRRDSYI